MSYSSPLNENISPEISIREENGVPVEFRCPLPALNKSKLDAATSSNERPMDNETAFRKLEINFEYEFAILDPQESIEEVMDQDLPNLEYGILYLVAKSTGLLKCNLKNESIYLWGPSNPTTPRQDLYLVSLSSGLNDEYNAETDACSKLNGLPRGQICVPIHGKMTAGYLGTSADLPALQNYLLHHIQREMDSSDMKVDSIQDVIFLGRDTNANLPQSEGASPSTSEVEQQSGNKPNIALASSLGVGLFILIVLLVAAVLKRRRQERDIASFPIDERKPQLHIADIRGASSDSEVDTEAAVGSFSVHDVPENDNTRDGQSLTDTTADVDTPPNILSSSPKSKQQIGRLSSLISTTSSMTTLPTKNVVDAEENVVTHEVVISSPAGQTSPKKDLQNELSKTSDEQPSEGTAGQVSEQTTPAAVMGDVLPPKPPGGTSSKPPAGLSKSIKVNRKKKKKKKPTLIRVNSRESINEMETITEEKEEKDSDCSEYSWYSTDDEDSRPGSRDPSPARSHSRSRDPSPSSQQSRGSGRSGNIVNNSSNSSLDDSSSQEVLSSNPSSSFETTDKDPDAVSESSDKKKNTDSVPTWV